MEGRLRAAFTGYYGMRNFGDDLFGAVCASASRRFWNASPLLVGPPIAAVQAGYTLPAWYPLSAYGAAGPLGKATRFCSFMRGLHGADVVVLGGGSVINGRTVFREPAMVAARRRGRVQLAAVGVSVGPFETADAEESARAFIGELSYLAVRDHRSYALAMRLGAGARVHRGRDLAGLLPMLLPATRRPAPPACGQALRIGIAPCRHDPRPGWPAPATPDVHAALVGALRRLGTHHRLQLEVFSLNEHPRHGDAALARQLLDALSRQGLAARPVRYLHCDPVAAARDIGHCDAFISTRLHGAIVAYMTGVPFMIVEYHPKCSDFADDIALPPACRIDAANHDAAAFTRGLEAMLAGQGMPGLDREDYSRQAQEIFAGAPWAAAA